MQRLQERDQWFEDVPKDVIATMIETDTIIEVQAYPISATGFYHACHFDLTAALKIVYEALMADKNVPK